MKVKKRDRLLMQVLSALQSPHGNAKARYELRMMGESLILEYKDMKFKDVKVQIERLADSRTLKDPANNGTEVQEATSGTQG